MIQIKFNDKAVSQLQELQQHTHPTIRNKAYALLLKSEKIPHHKIARIIGVSKNTARAYFKIYQQG